MQRLTDATVVDYLRRRSVIAADAQAQAEVMAGGVSNDVLAVCGPGVDVVVKQGLAQLRVAAEWFAPPERVLTEAAALRVAARLRPADVPRVLDVDPEALTLTIERAPRSMRVWKADLLDGRIDPATAWQVGDALADWHTRTWLDPDILAEFDQQAFVELRINPFYRTVAVAHPELADRIEFAIAALEQQQLCLVHGDFSPKNILCDGVRICVLDWEVAHAGNPVFDLAFALTHLLLKGVRRPDLSAEYAASAAAFDTAYQARFSAAEPPTSQQIGLQVACLLLARVDGKSPVEYLTEPQRIQVREVACAALGDSEVDSADLWDRLGASH